MDSRRSGRRASIHVNKVRPRQLILKNVVQKGLFTEILIFKYTFLHFLKISLNSTYSILAFPWELVFLHPNYTFKIYFFLNKHKVFT